MRELIFTAPSAFAPELAGQASAAELVAPGYAQKGKATCTSCARRDCSPKRSAESSERVRRARARANSCSWHERGAVPAIAHAPSHAQLGVPGVRTPDRSRGTCDSGPATGATRSLLYTGFACCAAPTAQTRQQVRNTAPPGLGNLYTGAASSARSPGLSGAPSCRQAPRMHGSPPTSARAPWQAASLCWGCSSSLSACARISAPVA
mmetsp:Transcript_41463/g.120058  ORF Transcript_41463/g.120058 Transcript_41463/m.120058 type:complete len:207 (+) Transcript_41463:42-662(+)